MNFRPDEVNHAFIYRLLPGGNSYAFPGIDRYIRSNGIKAWYYQFLAGGRVYAIPVDQLDKLPNDDGDPYLCTYEDTLQGWGLYVMPDAEEYRISSEASEWFPLFDTRIKFCLTYCGDDICDCMEKNQI